MATIDFSCAHCQQTLEATDDMAGEVLECPSCGKPITVPRPEAPVQAAATCPACGQAMESGSVLCVVCGYHTKLGKKIQTDLT